MTTTHRQNPPSRASRLTVAGPVVLGMLLAGPLLWWAFGDLETAFDKAALGRETTAVFCRHAGAPLHTDRLAGWPEVLAGWRKRGSRPAALWLGNSQLHGVNQAQPGNKSAPGVLFARLDARGVDLLAFSPPNAGPEEHLLAFEYMRKDLALKYLIVGVCFDDFRVGEIRDSLLPTLADARCRVALATTEAGRAMLERNPSAGDASGKDYAGVARTTQEHSERFLNETLDEYSALWHTRPQARGEIFLALYLIRNTAFGITAQTQRRMLRPAYLRNMSAVAAMLNAARKAGIRVLVYVVPIRGDVAIPYVQAEYASFKKELGALVRAKGGTCADLGALVPGRYWGSKDSTNIGGRAELDFMHFQVSGHEFLAERVADVLAEIEGKGAGQ